MSFTSKAYTEEEKAQAKAWLSAHGYSPDMGGASQAYQDYLNGKFDEELGVDVNGDGIPVTAQTTEEGTMSATTENATEGETETDADESSSEESVAEEGAMQESVAKEMVTEESNTEESTIEDNTEETVGGVISTDSEEASDGEKTSDDRNTESMLYLPENMDMYQEAAMVIVLGAVLMVLMELWLK